MLLLLALPHTMEIGVYGCLHVFSRVREGLVGQESASRGSEQDWR